MDISSNDLNIGIIVEYDPRRVTISELMEAITAASLHAVHFPIQLKRSFVGAESECLVVIVDPPHATYDLFSVLQSAAEESHSAAGPLFSTAIAALNDSGDSLEGYNIDHSRESNALGLYRTRTPYGHSAVKRIRETESPDVRLECVLVYASEGSSAYLSVRRFAESRGVEFHAGSRRVALKYASESAAIAARDELKAALPSAPVYLITLRDFNEMSA
jgi:hypothetical protein